jgi:dihydroorotate dehydrogenase electron transfer subunit
VSWSGARQRVPAPFGRRRGDVLAVGRVGAYVVLAVGDPCGQSHPPQPGQFYMVAASDRWGAGEGERPFLPRALSVMRARDGVLQFLLEDVGPGTRRLCELGAGEQVWLTGPLGDGFRAGTPIRAEARTPILVGGGVGIAPLAILSDELCACGTGGPPTTLLGFRDAEHAGGGALLREPRIATDDGSVGHHGRVTELLEPLWDDPIELYACGPPPMLEAVRRLAAEHAVPAQLALESPMACGFGACYGCVVATVDGYRRVCVDGPVFDAATLAAVR